jgi:iron complex outermembrane receptor protein
MWGLAVGARWMEDKRGQQHIEYNTVRLSCNTVVPLEMCDVQYIMNRNTMVDNGIHANVSAKFSETTPMVSITRFLTPGATLDSGMIYGSISEGYLTGAFNDEINPNNPGFDPAQRANIIAIIPYGPEFITNYEVGFKGALFDSRLRLSAAAFLMDYTDKQEAITVDNSDGRFGPDPNLEYTQNAADVEVTGIEFSLQASPWDGGFISLDLGYLDSKYSNFKVPDLDNPTGPLVDVSATSIANRTPDWTITASVEHAFALGNGATLTPQIGVYMQPDFEWRSGRDVGDPDHPLCHQSSYTKVRLRATYVPEQGNWQASLFGYNITDEEILFRCAEGRSGAYQHFYEAPARWGAEFTMRFGG